MKVVNATEMKNSFGKYLKLVKEEGELIIRKNGKEVAKLISTEKLLAMANSSRDAGNETRVEERSLQGYDAQ